MILSNYLVSLRSQLYLKTALGFIFRATKGTETELSKETVFISKGATGAFDCDGGLAMGVTTAGLGA